MEKEEEILNKRPANVLRSFLGKKACVRLKNDFSYKGQLENIDPQMNMILKQTVEYRKDEETINFGTVLIRGNNVLFISLDLGPENQ
jgi:small nuclear ribonucleoprotein (snRNP)-like protein